MYNKIKKFYDMGLWTRDMVYNVYQKGIITEQQYLDITQSTWKCGNQLHKF